ncbi:MAG: HEAT repeat domain-containing protein, partial [Woeseiaceae bacterium]
MQRSWEGRHTFVGRLVARHANCPPSLVSQVAYYCYPELAHNPKFALQILENPDAIRGEPVKAWLLSEWVGSNGVPGHIANFYLQSDDEKNRRRAAANHRASMALLQPMALDADTKLRSALAARDDLTRFMFEVLARDKNNKTREIVAKNKQCPSEILTLLATDKTAAVRAGATQNRNFKAGGNAKAKAAKIEPLHDRGPVKDRIKMAQEARKVAVLADLAQDKDADVREAVADNDYTKGDVLTMLAGDSESNVRRRIPYQEATPPKVRSRLLGDDDGDVRYAAFNSSIHEAAHLKKQAKVQELVDRAAKDSDARIRSLAGRYTTNAKMQAELAAEGDKKILRQIARNSDLSAPVARMLMKSDDRWIRNCVASSIADLKIIRLALQDSDSEVKWAAACNPLLLENAMDFIDDSSNEVRESLAMHIDQVPEGVFEILVDQPGRRIQKYLASAKKMTRDRVAKLVAQASPDALWELTRRNKLNEEDYQVCISHSNAELRQIAAGNSDLSDEDFDRLLKDTDSDVRDMLTCNKNLTKTQKAKLKAAK